MMRGFIIFTLTMTVITTSVIMYEPQASMQTAYEASVQPVEVPYLDLTINQVREQQNGRTDKNVNDADHQDSGKAEQLAGADDFVLPDEPADNAGSAVPELVESGTDLGQSDEPNTEGAEDPILTYYGNCRITFYDVGPCCCGEFANGYTASGEEAIVGWTCANGALDFGTLVMIDGHIYCVTDRGVNGDEFDILVSSHEEALQRGLYYADVYIVN